MAFSFLDFIFPKRCVNCGKIGAYFCTSCFLKIRKVEYPVCPVCQRQAIGGRVHPGCKTKFGLDGLVAAFRYWGPVKQAILKIKYRWIYDISETLVGEFSKEIWRFSLPEKYILVPIPLHKKRKNWRGFNQAELFSKILAKEFNVGYKNYLVRVMETKTQVGLTKEERKKNIRDAFQIVGDVKDKNILLVDDVYTTGATIFEACKVLKRHGAGEVWGMVIALG